MMDSKEVVQVIPTEDYKVYIYFDYGSIKLYDVKEIINKRVFTKLKDKKRLWRPVQY
jgi:hypothetical protein